MNERFWMVMNVTPRPGFVATPKVKHLEFTDAVTEAKRLASLNAGARFVILESVCAYEVIPPEPTRIALTARNYTMPN